MIPSGMRRAFVARWVAASLSALSLAACNQSPRAVAQWRMADRTLDVSTDRPPGEADVPGPDGFVDDYDNAQGTLVRGMNGNISTKFPADGRYEVVLDACASEWVDEFAWAVDGGPSQPASACRFTTKLTEGAHTAELVARNASGQESRASVTLDVKNLIVVGLGDSFSAGSGNSRNGLLSIDYDQVRCTRTGRSGQALAALALEKADEQTSVTFIHLACGGARATTGFLRAHNNQPPQLLELLQILPAGRAVDFVSFSIGGNDVRFSEVIEQLIGEPDAPLTLRDGERVHDRVQRQLGELRATMADVAACFGAGFEGRPCRVTGPSGRDDDTQVLTIPRIPLVAQDRLVQVTYPDLSTYLSNGVITTCPSGAVEPQGDLLDGLPDGLLNGRPLPDPRPPRISFSEWSWGGAVMLGLVDPAPDNRVPAAYAYVPEAGGAAVPLPFTDTLNALVLESRGRFGWTASDRWFVDSRGHGYCSPPADNWYLRSIFHPNVAGYEGKARGLLAEAQRLGLKTP
jgi:lysophospholipase L1-like esterase